MLAVWCTCSVLACAMMTDGEEQAIPEELRCIALAARAGDHISVCRFLEEGKDPTILHGRSLPLHLAAERGHASVVRVLLEHGVRPEQEDACGRNAMQVALAAGQIDIVRMLRERLPYSCRRRRWYWVVGRNGSLGPRRPLAALVRWCCAVPDEAGPFDSLRARQRRRQMRAMAIAAARDQR